MGDRLLGVQGHGRIPRSPSCKQKKKHPTALRRHEGNVVLRHTSGLQRLPYEVMGLIVRDLEIEEIFDLSLCCKHFQYLIREEQFCRAILTDKAPFALETQEAGKGGFARALRRLAKRRCAVSHAYPYVIGIVATADSYLYHGGVLCYVVESRPRRWLRILDLRNAATTELVVDIPALVTETVLGPRKSVRYRFRVLHHAEGITSCLLTCSLPETENWLLVFKAAEQTAFEPLPLDSISRIFVRNNADFVYCGTHSDDGGGDGFRRWVLRRLSLQDNVWLPKKVQLANVVGYEIGVTVCFEVIGDYFYGVSNQTTFDAGHERMDFMSYYYCFRFRLADPDPRRSQVMQKRHSWRRDHAEGPIDDRWGFLQLEIDEASGKVQIIESRKEWLSGRSGSRRTYYAKDVVFPPEGNEEKDWMATRENEDDEDEEGTAASGSRIGYLGQSKSPMIQQRSPHYVHLGDDTTTNPFYSCSQIYLRSYQRTSHAFLDLVDSAAADQLGAAQSLRLRAGARRLRTPSAADAAAATRKPQTGNNNSLLRLEEQIHTLYTPNQISMWPPALPATPCTMLPITPSSSPQQQQQNHYHPPLMDVYEILNPPSHQGKIIATGDERSVVYSTGSGNKQTKALIYLSFDPAAKLYGMRRWGPLPPESVGGGLQRRESNSAGDDNVRGGKGGNKWLSDPEPASAATKEGEEEEDDDDVEIIGAETKGKGRDIGVHSWCLSQHAPQYGVVADCLPPNEPIPAIALPPPREDGGKSSSWAWYAKPMYQDISGRQLVFNPAGCCSSSTTRTS